MAQIAKSEAKTEIKCPSVKVYDFLKYDMSKLNTLCPHIFKRAQLLEGEEGQIGNVKLFVLGRDVSKSVYIGLLHDRVDDKGKKVSMKVKTEAIDDEKKSITFRVIEGDVLELYTSFTSKATFSDGSVNWCIEVEKANDSAPNPDNYVALSIETVKALDHYILTR